ncbi:MAG: hypothetical protein IKJ84_00790 [Oscillospiraceae bacterium]|nr:hypothetical protein [Oscillospiraceae bacterium]
MKIETLKRHTALFLVNHILVGTRCYARKRKLLNQVGFSLGEGTRVVGPVYCTGGLTTGTDCWLGPKLSIYGNGTVVLEDNCDIGPEVSFLTGSHEIGDAQRRAGTGKNETIRVGAGCWIGGGSMVLGGYRIGKGSVVGAFSCVTEDLPENSLCCGTPARVIRALHE